MGKARQQKAIAELTTAIRKAMDADVTIFALVLDADGDGHTEFVAGQGDKLNKMLGCWLGKIINENPRARREIAEVVNDIENDAMGDQYKINLN